MMFKEEGVIWLSSKKKKWYSQELKVSKVSDEIWKKFELLTWASKQDKLLITETIFYSKKKLTNQLLFQVN